MNFREWRGKKSTAPSAGRIGVLRDCERKSSWSSDCLSLWRIYWQRPEVKTRISTSETKKSRRWAGRMWMSRRAGRVPNESVCVLGRRWWTGSTPSERLGSTTCRWPSPERVTRRWERRTLIQHVSGSRACGSGCCLGDDGSCFKFRLISL